jgi:PAS domain S-box-containing protein
MMKWLFENKEKAERNKLRAGLLQEALKSTSDLETAAKNTMNLAADVTETLQARIDDYANQIDHTSRLLSDALMLVDPEGHITSFNPAAETMFGWKRRQIIGKDIGTLFKFPQGTTVNSTFMEQLIGKVNEDDMVAAVHHEEFMGIKMDGSEIYVDVGASKFVRSDKKSFYIMLVRNVTHRVRNSQMIKELAARNQELLTTIDATKTGFMILDADGSDYKISFVNRGFAKITGRKTFEILQMNLRDILGVDKGFWNVRRTLAEQVEERHEVQLEIGEQTTWYEVQITPVFNKNKMVTQWILVFYDTTELKKAYHDLKNAGAHFRAFSEASSESMMIHSSTQLLNWNERLLTLTGYTEAELEKINPLDFVHPLEREGVRSRLMDNDGESYETLFMTKEGEVKEVAINSRAIEWDNTEAMIVVARDVTSFKDVDTQLKTSRERYKTVIDNTIDMVICFNSDLEITFSNQTFRDYFDVEVSDINGFSLLEIIPESDHQKFKDYMLSIQPETQIRRGVHRVKRHDELRWQDWIDRGIFDDDGNLIEIQSVARDITQYMPSQTP